LDLDPTNITYYCIYILKTLVIKNIERIKTEEDFDFGLEIVCSYSKLVAISLTNCNELWTHGVHHAFVCCM
jgi:hypothetical protein